MKKIFVLLAAFSLSLGVVSAQTTPAKTKYKTNSDQAAKQQKTPEQKADHAAQRMAKSLSLSADQTARVRQLHLARYQEMQAKSGQYTAAGNAKKHQGMKAGKEQYEAQLKQILSAEQYTKYAQMRAEKSEKHKANRKMKS